MDPVSMTSYIMILENQAGYMTGMNSFTAGSDGIFYTADDMGMGETSYTLDIENRVIAVSGGYSHYAIQYAGDNMTKVIFYSDSGSIIGNVKTIQFDVNNKPVSVRYYSDDEITQIGRVSVEYNGSGRIAKIAFYNSAGTDGVWGNGDDVIGILSLPMGTNYTGYAYGNPFVIAYGFASPLPVSTYEYDASGLNTRINGYSDNGVTLVNYSIMEYN
jgi:hypothetical protein